MLTRKESKLKWVVDIMEKTCPWCHGFFKLVLTPKAYTTSNSILEL